MLHTCSSVHHYAGLTLSNISGASEDKTMTGWLHSFIKLEQDGN